MKKSMKKLMLLAAVLLAASPMSAYDFEVDGVYYDVISLTDLTCKITNNGSGTYKGDFVIPQTVDYSNKTLTVTEISGAFYECYDLTSITIPTTITKISTSSFFRCSNLTNVTIPNSVTEIETHTFGYCSKLASVTIPNSVTKIGIQTFRYCTALKNVVLPNSLTEIGSEAFALCTALENVVLPNSITKISDGLFTGCTALTGVTIPNSVEEIGSSAFNGCTALTSMTIPDAVETIGGGAFSGCTALTNVTLGCSVKTIGSFAFNNCSSLTSLTSLATTPPNTNSSNFSNNHYMTVYVYIPQESVEAYKSADVWKNFWYITAIGSEPEVGGMEKCANPTIDYANGKLTFSCATSGATCVSDITDADIRLYTTNEVQLSATYNISVYATKAGYVNSDMVTATLCWIEADPKTEGIGNGVTQIQANAVLIQSRNGQIEISGLDDGTKVAVYGINGTQFGSAVSYNGSASIHTGMERGGIAIVKIGDRSIKVLMK